MPAAKPFDPETATFEELQDAANLQLRSGIDDLETIEQPASEEPPQVFERVIDLHDGSGAQVFRGNSLEELADNLAKAQEHATRKIRELAQSKTTNAQPSAPAEPNPDEEFALSQEFLNSPTKAFAKLFKKTTGMTIEEFNEERSEVTQLTRNQASFNAGREFALTHRDEYYGSDKNNDRMAKWLRMEGLPATVENLQKAFDDLSQSGLLEAKPQENNQDAGTIQRPAQRPRIVEPEQRVVGQRRAASGLSQRGSSATRQLEPTEDELYNMSYEQLAALARAEARANAQR